MVAETPGGPKASKSWRAALCVMTAGFFGILGGTFVLAGRAEVFFKSQNLNRVSGLMAAYGSLAGWMNSPAGVLVLAAAALVCVSFVARGACDFHAKSLTLAVAFMMLVQVCLFSLSMVLPIIQIAPPLSK